jgi:5-formyltetrahydrofolate cyclo-ligase
MTDPERISLRKKLRQQRRSLSAAEQQEKASRVYQQIVTRSFFNRSRRVALYFASDDELDPLAVLLRALEMGKRVYLPVLSAHRPDKVSFAPFRSGDALLPNRWGILEPDQLIRRLVKPQSLDLVFVPLVGFDASCNRLGMGKGFYDRSFAYRQRLGFRRPRLVGLAYENQKMDQIPVSEWDVPLDAVITEAGIYQRSGCALV